MYLKQFLGCKDITIHHVLGTYIHDNDAKHVSRYLELAQHRAPRIRAFSTFSS